MLGFEQRHAGELEASHQTCMCVFLQQGQGSLAVGSGHRKGNKIGFSAIPVADFCGRFVLSPCCKPQFLHWEIEEMLVFWVKLWMAAYCCGLG